MRTCTLRTLLAVVLTSASPLVSSAQLTGESHLAGGLGRTNSFPVRGLPDAHDIAWKAVLDPRDLTAPAIADGFVVFGERTSVGRVTALDAKTGRQVWQVGIGAMQDGPTIVRGVVYGAHGVMTPDYRFKKAYAEAIFAIDLRTGKDIWHRDVLVGIDNIHMAVANERVLVNEAGNFLALDTRTGKTLWTYRLSPRVDPAMKEVKLQVGTMELTETVRAKTEMAGCTSVPAVDDGTVFFVAEPARIPKDVGSIPDGVPPTSKGSRGWLIALDASTGQEKWRVQPVPDLPEERDHNFCLGQPRIANGVVITMANWTIFALDAKTGAEKWRATVPVRDRKELLNGEWVSHPVVTNDFVITRHNGFRGFTLATGQVAWELPLPGTNNVTVASGVLYAAGSVPGTIPARKWQSVFAYDLTSKQVLWKRDIDPNNVLWQRKSWMSGSDALSWNPSFVVPADDALYYATTDGMRGILVKLR